MDIYSRPKPGEIPYYFTVGSKFKCEVLDENKSTVDLIFKDKNYKSIPKFALEITKI